jgi:hypothetical protein
VANLVLAELEEVFAIEKHFAGDDAGRWDWQEPEDGERTNALAAAALAYKGEGFALLDVPGDAVHGLDDAFFRVEVGT